jgi:hypothetical protein
MRKACAQEPRGASATHREECLIPRQSATINGYPGEERFPGGTVNSLLIGTLPARLATKSWWIAPRRSLVRLSKRPLDIDLPECAVIFGLRPPTPLARIDDEDHAGMLGYAAACIGARARGTQG